MTKQLVVTAMLLAGLVGISRVGEASDEAASPREPRIRSGHARIVALIALATEQSATFRGLVETIQASDGIVYVQQGVCRGGVRACLIGVTKAGATRVLWIRVDTLKSDPQLMASMGHELRHAIEVLGNQKVDSTPAMILFYLREGSKSTASAVETTAAVEAGQAVALELAKR
jgi:hypothetical protein